MSASHEIRMGCLELQGTLSSHVESIGDAESFSHQHCNELPLWDSHVNVQPYQLTFWPRPRVGPGSNVRSCPGSTLNSPYDVPPVPGGELSTAKHG